jgi:Zn-dependent protease with chaperone function
MPIENTISRKLERDADRMAIEMTGLREPFISLMEKLAEKNLSDVNPNSAIEFLLYNHPSISKRIAHARTIKL